MKHVAAVAVAVLLLVSPMSGQAPKGRALTIEDYYRIRSVGETQISPDGRWVAFTLATKGEDDNTTAIETYVVSTEGAAPPRPAASRTAAATWRRRDGPVTTCCRNSINANVPSAIFIGPGGPAPAPRVNGDRCMGAVDAPNATPQPATVPVPGLVSADGKWIAQAKDGPRPTPEDVVATDFEKRHAARFKGRTFDWMRFQQDGQDYPTPGPRLRPAAEIAIAPVEGGAANQVTRLGFRPANLTWHPDGSALAFTADENWRDEQAYEHPDIYRVTTGGNLTRLTTDGYVWSRSLKASAESTA